MEKVKDDSMGNKFVVLTMEDLKTMHHEAAKIGAETAIAKLKQEQIDKREKEVDRRLYNTRLLLRNFHMLKENADNSIYGKSQMEESAADILNNMMNLYNDEVIVDSIKRSATRTAIIVAHIENMLRIYKKCCESSPSELDYRRFEILYDRYITEQLLSVGEIAKKQNISKESVYSDLKIAVEKLSAIIFGVDGLNAR